MIVERGRNERSWEMRALLLLCEGSAWRGVSGRMYKCVRASFEEGSEDVVGGGCRYSSQWVVGERFTDTLGEFLWRVDTGECNEGRLDGVETIPTPDDLGAQILDTGEAADLRNIFIRLYVWKCEKRGREVHPYVRVYECVECHDIVAYCLVRIMRASHHM